MFSVYEGVLKKCLSSQCIYLNSVKKILYFSTDYYRYKLYLLKLILFIYIYIYIYNLNIIPGR